MTDMIELDGSSGEGGGQIIRTALALSAITGKAFRIVNIRKNRKNPGLANQHLFCVKAMKELCDAQVEGAELGSQKIEFYPRKIKPRTLSIDIGTAGSMTLLMQSVLPVCILSEGKFRIRLKGGTDVSWSMPYDYMVNVLFPQLRRYADIEPQLLRRGYYPQGNGEIEVKIRSKFPIVTNSDAEKKEGDFAAEKIIQAPKISLTSQGTLHLIKGVSHCSKDLESQEVADRQAKSARGFLSTLHCPVNIMTEYRDSFSTGSGITLWAIFSVGKETDFNNPIVLGADALGERAKRAEDVGKEAAEKLINEIRSDAPVDEHLADNLIPFLGFYGGAIKVSRVSEHTLTNIFVVEQFLGKRFVVEGSLISTI